MQILSQKQTNHYLNGMHIHEFFHKYFSICLSTQQQAGLLLVCMQVQQFQIAADAARLVLLCLQAVRAVLEHSGSAMRTPWKRGANAKSAAQTQ